MYSYPTILHLNNSFFLPFYLVEETSLTTTGTPISDHVTTPAKGAPEVSFFSILIFSFHNYISFLSLSRFVGLHA